MTEHFEELEADRPRAQKNARRIRTNSVLALSAMFLSAISAAAVIWQVKVAADQRAATVWPYVQAGAGRTASPPFFRIRIANAGVGPALIRYFSVRVDGKPVRSWREFLGAISQDEAVRHAAFSEEIIAGSGWVLAPQNGVTAFSTDTPEAVTALAAPAWSRIQISFCYCSIFDDCWLSDWQVALRGEDPTPVKSCPTEGKFGVQWSDLDAAPAVPR